MKDVVYTKLNNTLARLLKTPPYLILFVTDTCWMQCRHCWFNEQWKETHLQSSQMTFDEYERLADSIDRIAFLSLTGGEAFTRPDIVEIAHMLARKTHLHRYQIPTSGWRTDVVVRRTQQMLTLNRDIPLRVDVSLDGTRATHETVREKRGAFDAAVETITSLNRLKEHYNYLDVGVITTISSYNQDEVAEIAEIVRRVHPQGEWMINLTRGHPRDPKAADVDPSNYERAHRIIEQRILDRDLQGHSGHRTASWLTAKNATRRKVIIDTVRGQGGGGGACAAGSLGAVIYSDGQVRPCELLEDTFGNVRDYNYDVGQLWCSARADEIRRHIQTTHCLCTQECFLSVSLLIRPQHWPDIVRQRIRVGRARGASPAMTGARA
ncbi:MAG: radical SAM protein [Candidatus Rokubacteria bacterium]|nr:radical SAM protein [Candidatus Rokubacteria bacterium]